MHAIVTLCTAVAYADRIKFKWTATFSYDPFFHSSTKFAQMLVAGMHFIPGIHDPDKGLF